LARAKGSPFRISVAALALALSLNASLRAALAQGAPTGTNGAIAYVVSNGNGISYLESSYLTGAPAGTPLTTTGVDRGGDSFAPAWAPNGRTLAFASTRTGNTQIYTVQLGVTGQPLPAAAPNLAGQPSSLCGLEICRLTNDPWADSNPSWSPDGQRLVFDSDRTSAGQKQIYTMNASGGDVRCLLCDTASNAQPAWSSSGLIAFQSNRSGSPQIYTMNAEGGEIHQIANQPGGSSDPSWSPNGSELAYTGGTPPHTQIFTVALDGGAPKQITHDQQGDDELPAWSPDGTEILVSHRESASNTGYMYAVHASSGSPVPNSTIAGFEGSWATLPPPASSQASPSGTPSPSSTAAPVPGRTAIARPLSGTVTVQPGLTAPAGSSLTTPPVTAPAGGTLTSEPGQTGTPAAPTSLRGPVEIPVASTYNATAGVVGLDLTTVAAAKASVVSAVVTGGPFSLTQPHADATPTLQLLGRPEGCGHGLASAASRRYWPRIRAHTRGSFRGRANFGRLSVKGTRWEIEDTCQGSVYRALQDDITVTDPGRHRTVVLTAGHSYLVRPYNRRPHATSPR
jgi:Tol biopolymer transport system component